MVELIGFEPTTCTLRTYRSSQLSYSPTCSFRRAHTVLCTESDSSSTEDGSWQMVHGSAVQRFSGSRLLWNGAQPTSNPAGCLFPQRASRRATRARRAL